MHRPATCCVCSLTHLTSTFRRGVHAGLRDAQALRGFRFAVNNAAINKAAPLDQVTEKSFDEHFAANVKSALFMSQAAARIFKPGAVIINISSLNSRYPRATSAAPRKRRLSHSPSAYHGSWGPPHSGRRCGTWHGGYANAPDQQQTRGAKRHDRTQPSCVRSGRPTRSPG